MGTEPLATIPIPPEATGSRPARVAEAMKAWIVRERLAPGERLPSETELMERFGMAKGTIREAMRILDAQGLVRTRTGPGGGTFIHEVSEGRARALLGNYFYFKDLTVGDIYALRRLLEPELAASLAGKLSEGALARLEAQVDLYANPAQSAEDERAQHEASLGFHMILAELAQNALLGFMIGFMATMLTDLTTYRRLYEPPNLELWRQGRDYHLALIEALRAGKSEQARGIMAAHMEMAQKQMRAQEAIMEKRFLTGEEAQ